MTTTKVPAARLAPDWLLATDIALCPCGCIGKRRKGGYVAKTLTGVANVVRRAIFSDDVATAPGVLQQIDARVKVVALFGLLVVAALLHTIPVLGAMYLGAVVLALASRVPFGMFIARVWLFVPIFTGIVVLPATLSLITPGEIVVPLGTWFGTAVGLTAAVASAQDDGEPGAKGEFVCANLDPIEQLQADHATLLTDRLALLGSARAAADANGNTKAVERIDRRIERATERQAKVAERQEKLAAFAAEHC